MSFLRCTAILLLLASCSGSTTEPENLFETGRLEGRIEGPGGEPIVGAIVSIEAVGLVTESDAEGSFALHPVALSGGRSFTVRVDGEGYEPLAMEIVFSHETPTQTVTFTLAPLPESPPVPVPSLVVTTGSPDEVMCVADGDELLYEVRVQNVSSAPVPEVVIHDTLDGAFARPLQRDDIEVNETDFPTAEIVLSEDGRSFQVALGTVTAMPSEGALVYTVTMPAEGHLGVWCNAVTARGAGGALEDSDSGCITTTLQIAIDLENEDGRVVAGAFDPSAETFRVGEGGPTDPDGLVLRVRVRNDHCFSQTEVVVTGTLSDPSVRYRGVVAGYPDHGTIQEETPDSIGWRIGELPAGGTAELRLRAEAIAAGESVHRVELFAAEVAGAIVHEEPITIQP